MNLFSSPKPQKSTPTPTLDDARANVEALRRQSQMRGRAAAMLTSGRVEAPTAQRATTGN